MSETAVLSWMAWTWPTAIFFAGIGILLISMAVVFYLKPNGGEPRPGALFGMATTRGDRLFISLLGSAFIHLAWLGLAEQDLFWASAISIVFSFAVFRWG